MSSAVCVTQLVLSSTCRPTQFHLNLICVWETNSLHMFSDIFSPPNNLFSNMNFFSMYLLWLQRSASWNILKHPETHSNRSRRWWIIVSNENHFRALLKGLPEDQSSNLVCFLPSVARAALEKQKAPSWSWSSCPAWASTPWRCRPETGRPAWRRRCCRAGSDSGFEWYWEF